MPAPCGQVAELDRRERACPRLDDPTGGGGHRVTQEQLTRTTMTRVPERTLRSRYQFAGVSQPSGGARDLCNTPNFSLLNPFSRLNPEIPGPSSRPPGVLRQNDRAGLRRP